MKIEWILLAAGKSRRFGENKLLFPVEGKPLYRHIFDRLQKICAKREEQLLTVVSEESLVADITKRGGKTVWNPHPEAGIASSIHCALSHTKIQTGHAYIFFVADQPMLSFKEIESFIEGFLVSGQEMGCMVFGERRGNPGIFSGEYAKKLLLLEGDKGGRHILAQNIEKVYLHPCSKASSLMDIDTKEDLKCLDGEKKLFLY